MFGDIKKMEEGVAGFVAIHRAMLAIQKEEFTTRPLDLIYARLVCMFIDETNITDAEWEAVCEKCAALAVRAAKVLARVNHAGE